MEIKPLKKNNSLITFWPWTKKHLVCCNCILILYRFLFSEWRSNDQQMRWPGCKCSCEFTGVADVGGWTTCWIQGERVCHFQNHYPERWACTVSFSPSPPAQSFPFPRLCCGARVWTGTPQCRLQSSLPKHWLWCADGPYTPGGKTERANKWETCGTQVAPALTLFC